MNQDELQNSLIQLIAQVGHLNKRHDTGQSLRLSSSLNRCLRALDLEGRYSPNYGEGAQVFSFSEDEVEPDKVYYSDLD